MSVVATNVLFFAVTSLAHADAPAASLRLVDGTTQAARLDAVDDGWKMSFVAKDAGKPILLSAASVVAWGAPREPAPGDLIMLADGGVLVADVLGFDGTVARIDSRLLGELKVSIARVRSILFRVPATGHGRDALTRKADAARPRSDQVWLRNGDMLEGAVSKVDASAIHLARGESTVKLPIENATAIVLSSSVVKATKHKGLYAVLGLADGTRLVADRVVYSKDRTQAEIRAGELSVKIDAAKIVFVQPIGSKAVYLSDLEPSNYRHIPLLDLKWDYHTDANVLGGRLRCRKTLYLKGLGVHSALVLTYRVPEGTKRLVGRIGIDDSAKRGGSVIFRVFVDDGSGKWQPRFASKVVRGSQPPQDLSIDLAGARQISLMTDFADRGDVLDHADWLDVAFVK